MFRGFAALVLALVVLGGCAHAPGRHWTTLIAPDGTQVRVYLAGPGRVTARYWERAPTAQDDLGGPIVNGRAIRGFYDRRSREMWVTDDVEVLLHETQHMLDDVCR